MGEMTTSQIIHRALVMLRNARERAEQPIKFGELPESTTEGEYRGAMLWCPRCMADESSATRGDYFHMPQDMVIKCVNCQEPLQLVTKLVLHLPCRHPVIKLHPKPDAMPGSIYEAKGQS